MSVVVVVPLWLRLLSPAVGVICDGRQSSAKCRRRSYSRRVAPEYTCSRRDDEHCGMCEGKGKVQECPSPRSQKPTKAIHGLGGKNKQARKLKRNSFLFYNNNDNQAYAESLNSYFTATFGSGADDRDTKTDCRRTYIWSLEALALDSATSEQPKPTFYCGIPFALKNIHLLTHYVTHQPRCVLARPGQPPLLPVVKKTLMKSAFARKYREYL